MLEKILPYEEKLFFLINGSHNGFADNVMWLFSEKYIWTPLIVLILFLLIYKRDWKGWLPILISIIVVIILCDQVSSTICKPYFARLRPTHYPGIESRVHTLYGYLGGKYGFLSGHAANAFGFAMLTSLFFRNKYYSRVVFGWASLMAYSRVYLGVHFISDVLAGAMAGMGIALLIYRIYLAYKKKFKIPDIEDCYRQRINTVTIAIACYIPLFSILSKEIILLF